MYERHMKESDTVLNQFFKTFVVTILVTMCSLITLFENKKIEEGQITMEVVALFFNLGFEDLCLKV